MKGSKFSLSVTIKVTDSCLFFSLVFLCQGFTVDLLIVSNRSHLPALFHLVLLSLDFSSGLQDNQSYRKNLLKLAFGNTADRRLDAKSAESRATEPATPKMAYKHPLLIAKDIGARP